MIISNWGVILRFAPKGVGCFWLPFCNVGKIAVGAEGLLFTPYFDSQIRGSFIGIDARHTLDHFARAVLEGITFSLKDSQALLDPKHELQRLVSVGGGAKNAVWL